MQCAKGRTIVGNDSIEEASAQDDVADILDDTQSHIVDVEKVAVRAE